MSRPQQVGVDRFDVANARSGWTTPRLAGRGRSRRPFAADLWPGFVHTGPPVKVMPKLALLLAMRAINGDSRYVSESLGIDAVLKLINRYIADHRALVLGDPECTTAVRVLLEPFVRAGWPQAVQMAERMDDLFR